VTLAANHREGNTTTQKKEEEDEEDEEINELSYSAALVCA